MELHSQPPAAAIIVAVIVRRVLITHRRACPIACHFGELSRLFAGLDMKLLRGPVPEIVEHPKRGDAELAIAGEIGDEWERLDKWPLFTERFDLLLNSKHELASKTALDFNQLRQQRFLRRVYCENAEQANAIARPQY